jgi:hypothetical protein
MHQSSVDTARIGKNVESYLFPVGPKLRFCLIYKESLRPGSICLYAYQRGTIGFAWGYNLDIFDCDQIDSPGLGRFLPNVSQFFYLDECGVLPQFQKQGFGTALVQEIFSLTSQSVLVLRTLKDSPMQKLITNLGGRIVVQIDSNRVIMQITKRPPNYQVFDNSFDELDH